jgi:hypothetical protein
LAAFLNFSVTLHSWTSFKLLSISMSGTLFSISFL